MGPDAHVHVVALHRRNRRARWRTSPVDVFPADLHDGRAESGCVFANPTIVVHDQNRSAKARSKGRQKDSGQTLSEGDAWQTQQPATVPIACLRNSSNRRFVGPIRLVPPEQDRN